MKPPKKSGVKGSCGPNGCTLRVKKTKVAKTPKFSATKKPSTKTVSRRNKSKF
jgi:hypothetical protein